MQGLSLSGGGFRATLFHTGVVWRLNEVGLLKEMKEITSVSGGSILSAYLGLKWNDFTFNNDKVATNYETLIVKPISAFCARTIDVGVILGGIINPIKHPGDLLINNYRNYLYGDASLKNLPDSDNAPRFTFYSTSMQTGASVRFTRDYLGEYHLGKIFNPDIKLAHAVAASSAFPPPLCPIQLKVNADAWVKSPISDLHHEAELKSMMWLVDGGVYDNLGLERLVKNCDTLFVSDAGAPLSIQHKMWLTRFSQVARTKRTLDIMAEQIRALRLRDLISQYLEGTKKGAYWGIASSIDRYPLAQQDLSPALSHDSEITRKLSKMRTRLNKFNPAEQGQLINWGYALADAALRSYFDSDLPAATRLPLHEHPIS